MGNEMIPWRRAWGMILLSVVLINGAGLMGLSYYRYTKARKLHDRTYDIVAIVQTTSHQDLLKSGHLSELLGLSVDKRTNLFAFDLADAEQRLKDTVAIKEAFVRRIRPGTVHVELTLRDPIALVGNYHNTAVDAEGIMFPLKPFYTPKKVPTVFFEEGAFDDSRVWGNTIRGGTASLAYDVLEGAAKILGNSTTILAVDVSRGFAPSFGQRQIILTVAEVDERVIDNIPIMVVSKRTLRLFPDNWESQLINYTKLRKHLSKEDVKNINDSDKAIVYPEPITIDLRLANLAFIRK